MRLGIFVGSFNPVHKGHISIVKQIINKNIVDKVLIIPTNNYWNKNDIIDIKHRLNMLNIYKSNKIVIDSKLNIYKYTYQIIRKIKKIYPSDELYLIIGADNIVRFDEWRHYKYLLKLNMIICNRDDIDIKYYLDKLNKKDKYYIISDNMDISSTLIRKNINNNKLLTKYLDKQVLDYIIKNNLYGE